MSLGIPERRQRTSAEQADGDSAVSTTPNRNRLRHRAERLLAMADVRVDGRRNYDMLIHDERVFARIPDATNSGRSRCRRRAYPGVIARRVEVDIP